MCGHWTEVDNSTNDQGSPPPGYRRSSYPQPTLYQCGASTMQLRATSIASPLERPLKPARALIPCATRAALSPRASSLTSGRGRPRCAALARGGRRRGDARVDPGSHRRAGWAQEKEWHARAVTRDARGRMRLIAQPRAGGDAVGHAACGARLTQSAQRAALRLKLSDDTVGCRARKSALNQGARARVRRHQLSAGRARRAGQGVPPR